MIAKKSNVSSKSRALKVRSAAEPPASQRVSRTRKALVEAGKRLLSNGRMDGASIDDIVREADVAKGSFYNHFPDREALVDEALGTLRSELEAAITVAQQGITDPARLVARGLLASFRYGMQNQLGARAMLHIAADVADPALPLNRSLAESLQAGVEQRVFKLEHLDAGLVLVLGMSDLGLARLLDLRHEFQQARDVMRGLCLTVLRALGVESRRLDRIVDDALAAVIDAPRSQGLV